MTFRLPNSFKQDPIPFIIALAALTLRWLHLLLVSNTDLVRIPIIDAQFYHQWAISVAGGDVVGKGLYFMSPLYPYLLGLIYAIFGIFPIIAMLLQGIASSVAVWILFRWMEKLADRRSAIISASLAALYAPFIFFDATLLTSTTIILLSTLILYVAEKAIAQPTTERLLVLGALIGLSALARPVVLLFVFFLWVIFLIADRPTATKRFGWVLAGLVFILTPVGIRNLVQGGEFALTASSAGVNFYIGNNPDATGLYWEAPFLSSVEPQQEEGEYRRVAGDAIGRELTTREASDYWRRQALAWIIDDPVGWMKLEAHKAFYFWNRAEFANNVSIYAGKEFSPLLRYNPVGFWLIGPLGVAGLFFLVRHKGWRRMMLPLGWTLSYFLAGLIFFISSEYRLPVTLPLFLGAGYALSELIRRLQEKRYEPAMRVVVAALVLMPVANLRTKFILDGENARMDWFNYGNTLLKKHDLEGGIKRFQKALKVDPFFEEGTMRLAEAYYRAGRFDDALQLARQIGFADPQEILKIARGNALQEAYSLLEAGSMTEAAKEFSIAGYSDSQAAAETTKVTLLQEAHKAFSSGESDLALADLRKLAELDTTNDPTVVYNLAAIFYQMNQIDSAEFYSRQALDIDSLNTQAGALLVRILNATGRQKEGAIVSERLAPESLKAKRDEGLASVRRVMDAYEAEGKWDAALKAYKRLGKPIPDTAPEDFYRLGRLYYRTGNYELSMHFLGLADSVVQEPLIPYYLGLDFQGLGQFEDAADQFRRSIAQDSKVIEPRLALASYFVSKKQLPSAREQLKAIAESDLSDPKLRRYYDALLDSLGERR